MSFEDNSLFSSVCGELDNNLKFIEKEIGVEIIPRGNILTLNGSLESVRNAVSVLKSLYTTALNNTVIDYGELKGSINMVIEEKLNGKKENIVESIFVKAGKKLLKPRSKKQIDYFELVRKKQIVFCCGPAGTGKTYLAVAFAVSMLKSGQVDKIILSRPAVEAGERLGFLPGDLKEKIDPFLRPIYDALNEMLPLSEVMKKIESGQIEIAPIAFMRGRTLSNSFVILDESQNTTSVQMKMFLTRLGENSKMIINGDLSQVDLPSGTKSGLREAIKILKNIKDIGFIKFDDKDVVRNSLVSKIVSNYENYEKSEGIGYEYLSKASNED
ncbi:MAG: phosphate starvation-inducible protein PhoH [Rickettsiales bacterium]|nr:phosphate starvation-inducible protein PhoH [Rickettsiales bacterium]